MRIALTLSYDGSRFQGSQQQKAHTNTVLNHVIRACQKLEITSLPVASGRTDKDVHALRQIIHLDVPLFWQDLSKLYMLLHRHLLPHINLLKITPVSDDFHARFSAKSRHYRYIISHGPYQPFLVDYCYFHQPLNISLCNEALHLFKGTHNFKYFKKTGSDNKSDVRTITEAQAYSFKNHTIISLKGNSFLRSQVRITIAALLAVNEGKLSLEELRQQIEGKQQFITRLAPASGLYLSRIYY